MEGCAVRGEKKARLRLAEETGRALHVAWLLQDPVFLHVEAVSRLIPNVSTRLSFSTHGRV